MRYANLQVLASKGMFNNEVAVVLVDASGRSFSGFAQHLDLVTQSWGTPLDQVEDGCSQVTHIRVAVVEPGPNDTALVCLPFACLELGGSGQYVTVKRNIISFNDPASTDHAIWVELESRHESRKKNIERLKEVGKPFLDKARAEMAATKAEKQPVPGGTYTLGGVTIPIADVKAVVAYSPTVRVFLRDGHEVTAYVETNDEAGRLTDVIGRLMRERTTAQPEATPDPSPPEKGYGRVLVLSRDRVTTLIHAIRAAINIYTRNGGGVSQLHVNLEMFRNQLGAVVESMTEPDDVVDLVIRKG